MQIDHDLTLTGNTNEALVIDGNDADGVFSISEAVSVRLALTGRQNRVM